MCGIVAVLRRDSDRPPPDLGELIAAIEAARGTLAGAGRDDLAALAAALDDAAARTAAVDRALRGVPGARALIGGGPRAVTLRQRADALCDQVAAVDGALDVLAAPVAGADVEAVNAALVRAKDAVWAVRRDRLSTAERVAELVGADDGDRAIEGFLSIQVALAAIDRLEVRGRDSAGLHVLVRDHGLDLGDPALQSLLAARTADALFGSGSVRAPGGMLAFVYKAAAEIGELGDNTAQLRAAIRGDELLRLALARGRATVLGHTRWASVGIISEPNAHPLNHEEVGRIDGPYVAAALNGDVDNFADLEAEHQLAIPAEITTDAKVIPTLVSRGIAAGARSPEAFRDAVTRLEGSVATAAVAAERPDRLLLALRGSGQSLNVGLAEDAFVVASEPYGLVEEADRYVRMDGELPADPSRAEATRGQIVVLDGHRAGAIDGIERLAYDGTPLPVGTTDVRTAEITTRDIDRGEYPHYLLKELCEAPASFRKTLRGKVVEDPAGRLRVRLGPETLPDPVCKALHAGSLRRIAVIGQGTAAVAGEALATVLPRLAGERLAVAALPATELSGFALEDDMSDTLVVAISQSGTTTDTNRTVDIVRQRGARVVAIVNRRNSDLVTRADGVLYTSDGRDVEMSVASTKAFYAQVAAGALLALAIAQEVIPGAQFDTSAGDELLRGLLRLPLAMQEVFTRRPAIAAAARHAPLRRHWAVVGNGANRVAAREIRIKLSELCYKSIACDATEDKKHIDLSSEPLVVVCAAGLDGGNADDVAKEVAIYRAHRATPIVIATDGEARYSAAVETITVPDVHPLLAFVLSAMVGHLFGYEAALAIDASARPLREARAAIEATVSELRASSSFPDELLGSLATRLEVPARRFLDGLRASEYDGSLDASTAVRLGGLLRYATGVSPLDAYQLEYGKVGTPAVLVEDLTAALTRGIEELTRPVDAIKHQAKTVTVGISRADDSLLRVRLVQEVLAAGCPRDGLSYRALRSLAALDAAVDTVTGFTRYRLEGDPAGRATIHVVDRGGISLDIPSRTEQDPGLRGTKRRVATEREVTAARAAGDGRTLVLVPELKGGQTTGITLLHVRFADRLAPEQARDVLQGYRGRLAALRDAVLETEPSFDEARLAAVPVVDLLTEPIATLARQWRT